MNTIIFTRFFLLIFLISLDPTASFAQNAQTQQPESRLFDAHVHIDFDNPSHNTSEELETYLNHSTGMALLLSPAYGLDLRTYRTASADLIHQLNVRTSEVATRYNTRFMGLCGVSYTWEESSTMLQSCLNLPNMIGAKIRLMQFGTSLLDQLSTPGILNSISETIRFNKDKLKIVLIHIPNEDYWTRLEGKDTAAALERDISSLEALLALVNEHKQIQFIIAHSTYESSLLEHLIARTSRESSPNLWLEVSDVFRNFWPEPGKHQVALKLLEFGIDRILYGSDVLIGSDNFTHDPVGNLRFISVDEAIDLTLSQFLERTEFSAQQKQQILYQNGEHLLSILK